MQAVEDLDQARPPLRRRPPGQGELRTGFSRSTKFRTMWTDAEKHGGAVRPFQGDPRVTSIGPAFCE